VQRIVVLFSFLRILFFVSASFYFVFAHFYFVFFSKCFCLFHTDGLSDIASQDHDGSESH